MDKHLKVLHIDAASAFYRVERFPIGPFWGPVDLGLHLTGREAGRQGVLNFGTGLLAGSILPGSNRLIFTGHSPCWGGFYVSAMGGAGLIFDDLGINMVSLRGKAQSPSVLVLNREHGEEVQVQVVPVDAASIWQEGRGGVYSMMDHVFGRWAKDYTQTPRVLAVGPAAAETDFGAIASAPYQDGKSTHADCWAGRGGFGSKLYREHNICAVIYGGTCLDEDFRDRTVADEWFKLRYQKQLAAKDFEATAKYRFDPKFNTGGTFGVNYSTLGGRLMAFNYKSVLWTEEQRTALNKRCVTDHYLKQFNEETIVPKQQRTCGEPCAAVCKKLNKEFKKDYEPYQTMGPLCGVFDQRAAERLNGRADAAGFDAISVGGVLAWLMECLHEGLLKPEDLGVSSVPHWETEKFDIVADSAHNADLGIALIEAVLKKDGGIDLSLGARKLARRLSREKSPEIGKRLVFLANARNGWMVPNQYWNAGAMSPMAIMGKYYMYYGFDFVPPRELGRLNANRLIQELVIDDLGICRFHRGWAEEMAPEIVEHLWGNSARFLEVIKATAGRLNSRNVAVFWESERNMDYVMSFLKRKRDVEGDKNPELDKWIKAFEADKRGAALDFWFEIRKGISETLTTLA
ncbi:MAG: aldehyde ferredoxin oxidoreductase [Elusimicrobia bacterium GWA2_61_42]|nr:MAG: aldehyde ferredoxin oxidoreductase [Elusimicrobia bacterium GWA2_61_42]OGR74424.1 MAG: aldehyde ferredoxin oxidoreductase [Elusimicrobia bacterium GWC2_61_25]